MKVKAYCILIRGRKIVAKIDAKDVMLPGGDVDADKAQDQLSKLITDQCGVVPTKPVMIADAVSMGAQLYVAYVNTKKQEEVKNKGSWDDAAVAGHWTDDVYRAIEKIEKRSVMHSLLLLAMKLIKMMMDKESDKKGPKSASKAGGITKRLRTAFSRYTF